MASNPHRRAPPGGPTSCEPTLLAKASYIEAAREFQAQREWPVERIAYLDGHFAAHLGKLKHAAAMRGVEGRLAPQNTFWLLAGDHFIGEIRIAEPIEAAWKRHEQSGRPLPPVEARPQATSGSDPAKSGEPLAGCCSTCCGGSAAGEGLAGGHRIGLQSAGVAGQKEAHGDDQHDAGQHVDGGG